jgi:hypothetical protein
MNVTTAALRAEITHAQQLSAVYHDRLLTRNENGVSSLDKTIVNCTYFKPHREYWRPLVQARFNDILSGSSSKIEPLNIANLDSELDGLLQLARVERNQKLLVCTLPSEILVSIFALVRDVWPAERQHNSRTGVDSYTAGWMNVMHVCKSWRNVRLFAQSCLLLLKYD